MKDNSTHENDHIREPRAAYGPDPNQGHYTIEDYYALPEERRVELIDGWIYDMAAPSMVHQLILGELHLQLAPCVEKHPGCHIFFAPFDVRLDNDDYTMVQPDLAIICGNDGLTRQRMNGAPDFIIEILSPSSRAHDMFRKLNKYQAAGVREYWIVDPEKQKIIVYDLEHEEAPATYDFAATIPVLISQGTCSVDFARINEKLKSFA